MSTKIYDAYLYKGTLHQLLPFLAKMREKLRDEFVIEAAGSWAPKDFNFGAFTDGLREMFKRGERFAVIDGAALENPACSAVVYPTQIDREDVLLVQFFGFGGDTLDKLLPKTKFRTSSSWKATACRMASMSGSAVASCSTAGWSSSAGTRSAARPDRTSSIYTRRAI
jgi:hypothetical protein